MITIDLNDMHLKENLKAMQELKEFGFTDEEIQSMYNKQVQADKGSDDNDNL